MKKVKHSNFDLHVEYKCSECGWIDWLTPKQYNNKNFFVVCADCGEEYKPVPFSLEKNKINCKVSHKENREHLNRENNTKISNSINDDKLKILKIEKIILQTLMSYGFNKNNIIKSIRSHSIRFPFKDAIKETIKNIEHET